MTLASSFVAGVDVKDFQSPFQVGASTITCRSKRPGRNKAESKTWRVGGGDDNNAGVAFKPVHFREQLVEGLFSFVVAAANSSTALTSDRVNFINEDQAGGRCLLLLNKSRTREAPTPRTFPRILNRDAKMVLLLLQRSLWLVSFAVQVGQLAKPLGMRLRSR